MARRLKLPVMADDTETTATATVLRERLGGRLSGVTDAIVGQVVAIEGRDDVAVALFADASHVHVLVGEGLVRRVPRAHVCAVDVILPPALTRLASEVRAFAELAEGQRVEFSSSTGELSEGTVVEKCRYGALVRRGDGSAVGVGFRRLWPSRRPVN